MRNVKQVHECLESGEDQQVCDGIILKIDFSHIIIINLAGFLFSSWEKLNKQKHGIVLLNSLHLSHNHTYDYFYLFIYLFIYRFVQCTGERTIGHVVPYLVHPPNPTP